jgi:hypothetical protein|tara:strand:- start:412 stop:549 length:138 start_codon:yes stop_codon:yes gene_type:complete
MYPWLSPIQRYVQAKPKEKAYTVADGDGLAFLCLSRLYRRRVEEN